MFVDPGTTPPTQPRRPRYAPDPTAGERKRRQRERDKAKRLENVAVLDMETDPFDNVLRASVAPFLAVLYSDKFAPIVIWQENFKAFVRELLAALASLPEPFTIYAHNGGRFDFMFLISEMRGDIQFKGRGIMRAHIGLHELRDSFHIIPEALKNWKKDSFQYDMLKKSVRNKHREEIISYCISDCKNLLEIVKGFLDEFGFKISIGSAAMAAVKKAGYDVKRIGEKFDNELRAFYFGGRVQCLAGAGEFVGNYKCFDVNSMYPHVMASCRHPIGDFRSYSKRLGDPGPDTVFVDLFATNRNALMARAEDGSCTTQIADGQFFTTIWEYETAMRLGMLEPWNINCVYDCVERTDFSKFVLPLYDRRIVTKNWLKDNNEASADYWRMKKEDTFLKLILNNAYGKFAINPRHFREHYITDPDTAPPEDWFDGIEEQGEEIQAECCEPEYRAPTYWIWSRPTRNLHFLNVATAASITGAARAMLMEGIHGAENAIYCDTDSIICTSLGPRARIDNSALGAWKIENEFRAVRITGKKQYAGILASGAAKIRSKGAAGLKWEDFSTLLDGGEIHTIAKAPTLTRFGEQFYIERKLRATA